MCIRQTVMLINALTWGFDALHLLPTQALPTPCIHTPASEFLCGTGVKLENLLLKEEISSIRQLPGFLLKLTFSFQERLPGLSPLHFSPKYQEDHEAKDEGSTVLFVLFLFLSSWKAAWTNRCWASYWVAWKGVSKNYKQRGTAQR